MRGPGKGVGVKFPGKDEYNNLADAVTSSDNVTSLCGLTMRAVFGLALVNAIFASRCDIRVLTAPYLNDLTSRWGWHRVSVVNACSLLMP